MLLIGTNIETLRRFLKRNGILIGVLAFLIVYTWSIRTITAHNVEQRLAEQYEQKLEKEMATYKEAQQAAAFTADAQSKQAAINSDAVWLAKVGQGVLNTYSAADEQDAKKAMLCVICRVHSAGEFAAVKSIEDAARQKNQWWGFSESLTYTEAVYFIALEVSEIYHNQQAMPCPVDMCYASWNGSEIVLRNQWEANAQARYY